VQICNTCTGEGSYIERKKTGSLYAVRNIYKQLVPDDEWFRNEHPWFKASACRCGSTARC